MKIQTKLFHLSPDILVTVTTIHKEKKFLWIVRERWFVEIFVQNGVTTCTKWEAPKKSNNDLVTAFYGFTKIALDEYNKMLSKVKKAGLIKPVYSN